jgi:Ni,Fe-hydrogenase maturation factor
MIANYDQLIIIDAIKTGREPGTIYELSVEALSSQPLLYFFQLMM